ncbi:hypothetical protein AOLI_G00172130 [Acnodon oligacanthus]
MQAEVTQSVRITSSRQAGGYRACNISECCPPVSPLVLSCTQTPPPICASYIVTSAFYTEVAVLIYQRKFMTRITEIRVSN